MKSILQKRVAAHVVEKVLFSFMVLFGAAAVVVFFLAISSAREGGSLDSNIVVVEILIMLAIAILAQTVFLVKLYERVFLSDVDPGKLFREAEHFFEREEHAAK
ncbi:hypothetical protein D6783_01515 [Candidatus Woesearchaeota archaeon]|nr:MAG: hypothetical protein D6783_01515 [Candidatus Woesearchaeota archaeon]